MAPSGSGGRDVLLLGMGPAYARDLSLILQERYNVRTLAGGLPELPDDIPADCVIVAGPDGLEETARQAAMRVRTEMLLWQPVVLLVPTISNQASEGWGIYAEEWPPDIGRLYVTIDTASAVPEDRRTEVCRFALFGIWEDIAAISGMAGAPEDANVEDLRELFQRVLNGSENLALPDDTQQALALRAAIGSALTSPRLEVAQLATLRDLAAGVEAIGRRNSAPQGFLSDLHRLLGVLSFSSWERGVLWDHLRHLRQVLPRIPTDTADQLHPGLGQTLSAVRDAILSQAQDAPQPPDHRQLFNALRGSGPVLGELSKSIAAIRATMGAPSDVPLARVLVIEDDDNWRAAILALLTRMGLSEITEHAITKTEAQELLRKAPQGTYALIDLGLPLTSALNDDNIVELDAGLDLMREFSSPSGGIRFVVLTSQIHYSDAVRRAIAAGVDPWDYIQKGPQWQDQLASRLTFALAEPPRLRPRVEVIQSTGRLIRVDGVEIELNHKPYVVFAYLASCAPRWCSVDQIRTNLTMPGRWDITPAMGRSEADAAANGAISYPGEDQLLTDARLQDYIFEIRSSILEAFGNVGRTCDLEKLIGYQSNPPAYRLDARATIVENFEALAESASRISVLVVEDETPWSDTLCAALTKLGFNVRCARTLAEAKETIFQDRPDLISLDLQIPSGGPEPGGTVPDELNSLALLEWLAQEAPDVKVAVFTSIEWKDDTMLNMVRRGVQVVDYISKQWDDPLERLGRSLWRLMLQSERHVLIGTPQDAFRIHRVEIAPPTTGVFQVDGYEVSLSPGPARIFAVLARNRNAPVDRDLLKEALWPDPDEWPDDHDNALNKVIQRIRDAISKATGDPDSGHDVIRGKDGVYWLQGVVVVHPHRKGDHY